MMNDRARAGAARKGRAPSPRDRDRRYTLAKLLLVIAIAAFTALVIGSTAARDVPFDRIVRAMEGAPALEGLSRLDVNAAQQRLGVDPDGLGEWLMYGGDSVMEVSELLVAKANGAGALDALEDAARARLASQIEGFRNYGTNQIALLERAVLWRRGDYLFYGVSESVDQLEARFLSCIR